jgi:hypothetical protein
MQKQEIDLKHHGLGPKGAKAIAVALVVSRHSRMDRQTDAGCIDRRQKGTDKIHKAMPKNSSSQKIMFVQQSNTNVLQLNLSDNGLESDGGLAVASMLKENCYISQLVIKF